MKTKQQKAHPNEQDAFVYLESHLFHIGKHCLQFADHTVSHALKSMCGIGQPTRSEQIFKKAKLRNNCSFLGCPQRQ
jgi:hypothetical protein